MGLMVGPRAVAKAHKTADAILTRFSAMFA